MLTYKNFSEAGSILAALFMPISSFSTSKILKELLNVSPEIFDGDPTVLPIPDNAPPDIPRIILQKKDKSMKLEVAPIKLSFSRIKINNEDQIQIKDFLETATCLLTSVIGCIGADISRIAVVLDRFHYSSEPSTEIATHFCKSNFIEAPFDRPSGFELHALKKYKLLNKFDVNSWVKVKSGESKYEKDRNRVIIAQQDINTLSELMDNTIYDNNDVTQFYENILIELDNILELYFPEKT